MKNITLSADEKLIERARAVASTRHTTLNQLFRDWLQSLDSDRERLSRHRRFMDTVKGDVSVGHRRFSREEMNER